MKKQKTDHFEELLPWLANKSLDGDERAMMEQQVSENDAAKKAFADEQHIAGDVRSMLADKTQNAPAPNWLAMRNRLIEEQNLSNLADSQAAQAQMRAPTKRTWFAPVQDWFKKHGAVGGFAIAQTAALVAIFAYPGAILGTEQDANDAEYRVYSETPASVSSRGGGNVMLAFSPDINEQMLRTSLNEVGASIVGGPTETGAYIVRVNPEKRDTIVDQLRNDKNIMIAEPIEGQAQ